jgi:hypothetical protein
MEDMAAVVPVSREGRVHREEEGGAGRKKEEGKRELVRVGPTRVTACQRQPWTRSPGSEPLRTVTVRDSYILETQSRWSTICLFWKLERYKSNSGRHRS